MDMRATRLIHRPMRESRRDRCAARRIRSRSPSTGTPRRSALRSSSITAEDLLQLLQRETVARGGRVGGNADDLRDLAERESLDRVEQEDLRLLFGQAAQCGD